MISDQNNFQEKGFMMVSGLADTTSLYMFIKKLVDLGKGQSDKQVPGAVGFYKNPLFEKLLENLLPAVEQHTGYSLYKTYSYARKYNIDDELKRHLDRPACEVTVSLCLGNDDKPWPIWVLDKDKNKHCFEMQAGDALIFKGVELLHWRQPNVFGPCANAFLHYVDRHGPYADQKDDLKNTKGHY
jgi:hypothetical protein